MEEGKERKGKEREKVWKREEVDPKQKKEQEIFFFLSTGRGMRRFSGVINTRSCLTNPYTV